MPSSVRRRRRRRALLAGAMSLVSTLGFLAVLGLTHVGPAQAMTTQPPCVNYPSGATGPVRSTPTAATTPTTPTASPIVTRPTSVPTTRPTFPTLPPPPPCGGTVAGTISGIPAGMTVLVGLRHPSGTGGYGALASVDSTGAFRLNMIPAGTYVLQIIYPGTVIQYYPGTWNLMEAARLNVTGGVNLVVNDSVLPHGSVTGRVTDSFGAGVATNVRLLTPDGQAIGGEYSYYSDANGYYSFPIVPPGGYKLSFVYSREVWPNPIQYSPQRTSLADARVYQVAAGSRVTVDEQLLALGTVQGTYTRRDGTPVSGIRVTVVPLDPTGSEQVGYTDGTGAFSVRTVPGAYQVRFDLGEAGVQWWELAAQQSGARTVQVTSGGTVNLAVRPLPTGKLAGRVIRANGTAAAGVSLVIVDETLGRRFVSNADETGRFTVDVPAGSYKVRVRDNLQVQWASGQTSAETANRYPVRVGRTTVVYERLRAPGSLRLTAVDGAGARIHSFCARVVLAPEELTFACSKVETGVAQVAGLGAGSYQLIVYDASTGASVTVTATVQSGRTTYRQVAIAPS